jgi:hypothetical protein
MDYFVDLATDTSLVPHSNWHALRKFLVSHDHTDRMRDEPWTGDEWWDLEVCCDLDEQTSSELIGMQNMLPVHDDVEHCLAPFQIFLDEGQVSSHVQMHPIVLRGLWLTAEVRDGSGNGGGIIIGFMPKVRV